MKVIDTTDSRDPLAKSMHNSYAQTRRAAEERGIPWRLTQEEFASVWGMRWIGRRSRQIQMVRIDKARPYEIGNVELRKRTLGAKV